MLDPMQQTEPASAGFFMPEEMQPDYASPEMQPQFGSAKTKLIGMADKINLADDMSEEELKRIGMRVVEDYEIDEESRKEWLARNKEAIELANQVKQEKTFPWQGAANVKLPLIADAAIKFAARAYGEIVRDNQVVKGKVVGGDPEGMKNERAMRVGRFMSWQLTEQMDEWEEDTDKLLHVLPVVGHVFRKLYYCPARRRSVSQLVMPENLCVNYTASSLESARRITHVLKNVSKNAVIENQRSGAWLDVDLKTELQAAQTEGEPEDSKYYDFLEQHTWLDCDDDGYEEPYIVTVEKESRRVVRIAARYEADDITENAKGQIQRIKPCMYFADYKFIPSFDGGYYHVGFGALLCPLNETANTIFNQLLDAGTMSNVGGGFLSKEIKVKSGVYRFAPNEWKKTEASADQLKNGVHPLPVREPSPTLFNLLGMVMELTKDLASVKDVLSGDAPGANTPATTTMALIAEAKQSLNAIYKRIYRSMKCEFGILFRLNAKYLDEEEYYRVLDEEAVAYREDFDAESCDVVPMADPAMSSDMQRMAQADALGSFLGQPGISPRPIQIKRLKALKLEQSDIDEILPEEDPNAAPDPTVVAMQHEAEMKQSDVHLRERELDLKEREGDLKAQETEARIVQILSQAVKNFADAEAAEAGQQLQSYQAELSGLLESIKLSQSSRQQLLTERQAAQKSAQAQPNSPQGMAPEAALVPQQP